MKKRAFADTGGRYRWMRSKVDRMLFSIVSLLSICFFVSNFAFAEEKKLTNEEVAETYELARQFASCAGLFETMRDYATRHTQSDAMVNHANGLANGAMLASQYLAARVMEEEKVIAFSENFRATFADYWSFHTKDGFTQEYTDELWKCRRLNSLQASIMIEIRKKMYGFK